MDLVDIDGLISGMASTVVNDGQLQKNALSGAVRDMETLEVELKDVAISSSQEVAAAEIRAYVSLLDEVLTALKEQGG
jgi:uncharacterized membrane protein YcaP (DUF421 family)